MKIGYFLSCEEFGPGALIEQARMAEEAGFGALWISATTTIRGSRRRATARSCGA